MKLGVFDSGLGGIMIAKAIRDLLPNIDIVCLGDTMHMPYGNRSEGAIYTHTKAAMEYLFADQDCQLIVMACNTASASALRKLQQEYLPQANPGRRILGVVVPTIEYALDQGHKRIGLIGTNYTVNSNVYEEELQKINPDIEIFQVNTPLLVPLIENDGMEWVEGVLDRYIKPLLDKNIETLILSCTHYACLKDLIRQRYDIDVISQDEIIPIKLQDYLNRHPESMDLLSQNSAEEFYVTDLTDSYVRKAASFFDKGIQLSHVSTDKAA